MTSTGTCCILYTNSCSRSDGDAMGLPMCGCCLHNERCDTKFTANPNFVVCKSSAASDNMAVVVDLFLL